MNVALHRRAMTEAEFLAWVEPQERRYEFDGTGPVSLVGSTVAHGIIQANLLRVLGNLLLGTGWRALGSDNFTRVASSLRLPDVLVIRSPADTASRLVTDPVAVFEILSDSTSHVDRFDKAQEYWETPPIQHYVMLDQGSPGAVVLSRGNADTWLRTAVDRGGVVLLPAIAAKLPIGDLYEGLTFPEPDASAEPG